MPGPDSTRPDLPYLDQPKYNAPHLSLDQPNAAHIDPTPPDSTGAHPTLPNSTQLYLTQPVSPRGMCAGSLLCREQLPLAFGLTVEIQLERASDSAVVFRHVCATRPLCVTCLVPWAEQSWRS